MIKGPLYETQSEMKTHTEAIRGLASHHHDIPEEKVARLYEIVLMRYKSEARIKDFLVVLSCKKVRELLRKWNGRLSKAF